MNYDIIIKISSNKPFFKNFKNIFLKPDLSITYFDKSHLNYIYEEVIDNIKYIFHAFFKDEYLCILYDTYDLSLNIIINNKEILLLKVNWILKKIDPEKYIYIIDIENKINNINAFLFPIRNKFIEQYSIEINDYKKIYDYKIFNINMKLLNSMLKEYDIHFKDIIKKYFHCNNLYE
jgi:hypothetical protein